MPVIIFAFVLAFTLGCQKSKPTSLGEGTDSTFSDTDFSDNNSGGYGGSLSGINDVTSADKSAINNALSESTKTAPEEGTDLPDDLLAEARKLLDAEKSGQDVTSLKLALANHILQKCAPEVAALAPLPGQPLLGSWISSDAAPCKVGFDITGPVSTGSSSLVYAVGQPGAAPGQSPVEGQMVAAADGKGQLQTKTYKGNLTDQPSSGVGSLTHPEFTKTKYGAEACTTAVKLEKPTSPIPENYVEAMKKNGKCHRQALLLMSPTFDNLFKSLDPSSATAIQGAALGIK